MEQIREYIKNNRRKVTVLGFMLLLVVFAFFFAKNDYFLYDITVVKVTEVVETEYYEFGKENPFYTQEVTATVMNGEHKGTVTAFENIRTTSGLSCFDLREGDSVFVTMSGDGEVDTIRNIKRDQYAVLLIGIFCLALYAVSSKQSGPVLLATVLNLAVFTAILLLRARFDIFILFIFGTVFFT
ncbi:MAG: hypothetical protein IIY02_00710, partial [Firmicutes bacterium]|nr:hypothetical protein [Bacillota bacterium]